MNPNPNPKHIRRSSKHSNASSTSSGPISTFLKNESSSNKYKSQRHSSAASSGNLPPTAPNNNTSRQSQKQCGKIGEASESLIATNNTGYVSTTNPRAKSSGGSSQGGIKQGGSYGAPTKPKRRPTLAPFRPSMNCTKIVIRNIPPSMTESSFYESIKSDITDAALWKYYLIGFTKKAPVSSSANINTVKSNINNDNNATASSVPSMSKNSICYIAFLKKEDAATFCKQFQKHKYIDPRNGLEYEIIVQRALYCGIPRSMDPSFVQKKSSRNWNKTDNKVGTLESDPEYLEFLQTLEQEAKSAAAPLSLASLEPKSIASAAAFSSSGPNDSDLKNEKGVIITPLMKEIRNKRNGKSTGVEKLKYSNADRKSKAQRKKLSKKKRNQEERSIENVSRKSEDGTEQKAFNGKKESRKERRRRQNEEYKKKAQAEGDQPTSKNPKSRLPLKILTKNPESSES